MMLSILKLREYWRDKRRGANWLLASLISEPVWKVTKFNDEERNIKTYKKVNLKELATSQTKFSPDFLRDAADLLYRNKQIDLWDNQKDRVNIDLMALSEGEFAYKESI